MKDTAPPVLSDAEYVLALIDTTFESVPEIKRHHERMRGIAARLAASDSRDFLDGWNAAIREKRMVCLECGLSEDATGFEPLR